jgi:hypothetical protein
MPLATGMRLQVFQHLLASAGDRRADTFVAMVQTALGERDLAIESLEKARNHRSGTLNWLLKADPRFDPLRDDPRVQAMVRWMGGG